MPHYLIETRFHVGSAERARLAKVITHLHSRKFTVPSLFIRVTFHYAGASAEGSYDHHYFGSENCCLNSITATDIHIQHQAGEVDKYNQLCREIQKTWDDTFAPAPPPPRGRGGAGARAAKGASFERHLHSVVISGVTGMDCGIIRPLPGQEGAWLRKNLPKIREKAARGPGMLLFGDLLNEIQNREDLQAAMAAAADTREGTNNPREGPPSYEQTIF